MKSAGGTTPFAFAKLDSNDLEFYYFRPELARRFEMVFSVSRWN